MALRFMDSFDHYASATITGKWAEFSNVDTASGGRNGTNCLSSAGGGRWARTILDAQSTWIVGLAYLFNFAPGSGAYQFLELWDDVSALHVCVAVNSASKLEVWRGGTNGTKLATGSTVLVNNVFNYIESKITISDTVGSIDIHLNGAAETLTFVTGSNGSQDTRNGGNSTASQIRLGGTTGTIGGTTVPSVNLFDDLYVCDGTGSSPSNDFLGDCRVQCLFPSGNGNSSQLTNSSGNSTNNYSYVDDTPPNGDTDYVESSNVGDKDTYAYQDLTPTAGTVYGVQPLMWARKTDAGSRSVVSVARVSATEADSAALTLVSSYQFIRDVRETKPGGGAWSVSDVNSAEFGVKINA